MRGRYRVFWRAVEYPSQMDALEAQAADTPECRFARQIAAAPPGDARDAEAALYRLLQPRIRRYGLRHLHDGHAAPDDDLLVSHLQVPLQGVQGLDALIESSLEPGAHRRLEGLPFNPERGEAMFVPKLADAKRAPANTLRATLLSVGADGPRELGRYVYCHQPGVARNRRD